MMTETKKRSGCLKTFFILLAVLFFIVLTTGFIAALSLLNGLPTLEELTPSLIAETSKVFAIDGSLITELHAEENREIIQFSQISDYVKDAVIAVEDKRFYEHQGVDYIRIGGALVTDIRTGDLAQGGSTITQQYVKNVYFSAEKTFRRKINEALIAIQLERSYTKDKILEMYLNTIFFGNGAYGIEKASEIYFGINASQLNLPQAALLAGLIRAPEIYSPFNDIEKAKQRRNLILELMYEQGFIESDEYLDALKTPVILNEKPVVSKFSSDIAPYFVDYVKQQLYNQKFTDYDVFKGGLRIYTTLDKDLQNKAEESVKAVFPGDIGPSYSMICTDPDNGYIYALIGGKDYGQNKFNIVTQGKRQPGSVFKSLVLIEAIKQHISPNNKYKANGPIEIEMEEGPDWIVDNYGGQKFEDESSIIDATVNSVNVVYAQLAMKVGPKNLEELCNEMEIYDIGHNPAIALGGLETGVTPLDIGKIFSTLASGGYYKQPVSILKITDSENNILYEYNLEENTSNKKIIEEPVAYYITQILKKVIESGTGKAANIGRPAAGKTGTTSDLRDAWFAGYTPELVTVVWMGYPESNKPMEPINERSVVGGTYPAEIWREFMSKALENLPVQDFIQPDKKILDVEICTESNLLPTFWCPEDKVEWQIFIEGEEPDDVCNIHNKIEVPDVIGMDIEEARDIFEDLNFEVTENTEHNNTYNKNIVYDQKPAPGTIMESSEGEKLSITLYVSKGRQTFNMPELIGLELEAAKQIIESYKLIILEIIYDFNSEYDAGRVFNQDPEVDSKVTEETQVKLYVSKGENPSAEIPDVLTLIENEALNILNSMGFMNINIIYEPSDQKIGIVFEQVPEEGTTYEKSNEIVLKISKGIEVPEVIGLTRDEAVSILSDFGFTIKILPQAEDVNGIIISQQPDAGEFLEYGSQVTIMVEEKQE